MAPRWSASLRSICKYSNTLSHSRHASGSSRRSSRPLIAPKQAIDVKHIRQFPALHAQNCAERNYKHQAEYPARIVELFEQWKEIQRQGRHFREKNNQVRTKLSHINPSSEQDADTNEPSSREALLAEARELKREIRTMEEKEDTLTSEIEELASTLPNLTSSETPRGHEPQLLGYINEGRLLAPSENSHVRIGIELDILDFSAASSTSGWGWYFLKNEGALLEQALIQYALSVTMKHGFSVVTPPSIVYSHISSACGFRPRDQGGEQQVYTLAQDSEDAAGQRSELSMTGTAEIPFAAMKANVDLEATELPLRIVGPSRCYRAEAGSHGAETKGLYRVHEFTKVEMFGWTLPDGSETELFNTMVDIQKEILQSLELHCRILEQPSTDLGASATRKQDIEAFFPSRRSRNDGWGEVTSTSICTDYQTRRLATRVRDKSGKLVYPYTVNGTALAVPRVLAAILENHWNETGKEIRIPKVLWPWMHGVQIIK